MQAKITELGKALRKLRIDRSETLGDMAEKLGITSSYLSAIEKGKRPTPDGLTDKISDLYGLGSDVRSQLASAADKTLQAVKLSLGGSSDSKREAALCFARSFDDLDDDTAESVIRLLRRKHDA